VEERFGEIDVDAKREIDSLIYRTTGRNHKGVMAERWRWATTGTRRTGGTKAGRKVAPVEDKEGDRLMLLSLPTKRSNLDFRFVRWDNHMRCSPSV
jgi:hypothetical protein